MARKPYKEDQSIHSMTTRQLRQYIADKAEEAQTRIDTSEKEPTKAFREAKADIIGRNGKVRKSTSYMSKAEMREYAYALRQFNSLDTTSGFAQSVEWKENKSKYETFVKNRIDEGSAFWKQFKTDKGNISKRGYKAYKDYISFIKGIADYRSQFGYRTLLQYAESTEKGKEIIDKKTVSNEDLKKLGISREDFEKLNISFEDLTEMNKMLSEVFESASGKGLSQADLIDKFQMKLISGAVKEFKNKKRRETAAKRKKAQKSKAKKTMKKVKKIAKKAASAKHTSTKQTSKSNIKVPKGRTYKGESVRERIN